MKESIIATAIILGIAGCHSQESKPFPNASSITRLDGSAITPSEIDETVSRLMHAAKVTGAGIAILNVSICVITFEAPTPDHAGSGHTQWLEDSFAHEIRKGPLRGGLDDQLETMPIFGSSKHTV